MQLNCEFAMEVINANLYVLRMSVELLENVWKILFMILPHRDCVGVCVSVSGCVSIYLSVWLSVCLSVCLFINFCV